MNPGFFDMDYVQRVPVNEPASEMLLCLRNFDEKRYVKSFGNEITFGYYHGDIRKLKEDVFHDKGIFNGMEKNEARLKSIESE